MSFNFYGSKLDSFCGFFYFFETIKKTFFLMVKRYVGNFRILFFSDMLEVSSLKISTPPPPVIAPLIFIIFYQKTFYIKSTVYYQVSLKIHNLILP